MRGQGVAFVCLVLLMALAPPAQAQLAKEWTSCVNKGGKLSPDLAIGGCTAIIQSGKESEKSLAVAFDNRGLAYRRKDQYGRAIDDYGQAIRLDPSAASAFYGRGTLYLETGQYDLAIADFNEAIRLDPQFTSAFNNRGNAFAMQRQYDRAIDDYNAVIRLHPAHANALNGRGSAYSRKG